MARINDQGFDLERLERVTEGLRSDVENGRCHGVAMIVALAALLRGRETRPAGAVDEERAAIANAIDTLIRASGIDGDEEFRRASSDAILDYSALQAWRDRVWFAGCGMDPELARLPEIDNMLAKVG